MPRLPRPSDAVGLAVGTAQAIVALPGTLVAFNSAVRSLTDSMRRAQETAARVDRVTLQMEELVTVLQGPVTALAPGLTRLAAVLDDDAVDTVPATLRRISDDVLPVVRQLRETQDRLGTIPGAALLGWRRPPT